MKDSATAYEAHAREFLQSRDQSVIGALVVDQWCRTLRLGAEVIELACGGGYPITRVLRAAGLQIWAIDSSSTLVDEFKHRFPMVPVQCAKVQESDFFGRTYDGAIAIGLIFLLSEVDQLALISKIAKILKPGGKFLFTAPLQKGKWIDLNTGLACMSLGQMVYEDHLKKSGFEVVSTFIDDGDNNYYDSERV